MVQKKKTKRVASKGAASAASSSASTAVLPTDFQKLNKWNKLFALIFAVQAVLIVVLSNTLSVPVTASYSAVDELASDVAKSQVLSMASRHIFDVRIAWGLAAGLLVFALGYLAIATVHRRRFEAEVQSGVNHWRWAKLGLGLGLLLTVVALLGHVQQVGVLISILFMTIFAAGLAVVIERMAILGKHPGSRSSHFLCLLSTLAAAFPWLVLAGGVAAAWAFDGKLPMYLYGVYGSTLLFTVALATAAYFRMRQRGKWADSLYTERMFMLLGLAAVTLIVWQIFFGALM